MGVGIGSVLKRRHGNRFSHERDPYKKGLPESGEKSQVFINGSVTHWSTKTGSERHVETHPVKGRDPKVKENVGFSHSTLGESSVSLRSLGDPNRRRRHSVTLSPSAGYPGSNIDPVLIRTGRDLVDRQV